MVAAEHLRSAAFELHVPGAVLMQSTGLLDKNGRVVFEGDVLGCQGAEVEVYWDNLMAAFYVKNGAGDFDDLLEGYTKDGEVVGNIYQGSAPTR